MTFRPVDSKREEFRKYLERAGVMDALTKVLVSLYEEDPKPDDALGYIRKHLCDGVAEPGEVDALKAQLEESASRVRQLEAELLVLRDGAGEPAAPGDQEEAAPPAGEDTPPAQPVADESPQDAPAETTDEAAPGEGTEEPAAE